MNAPSLKTLHFFKLPTRPGTPPETGTPDEPLASSAHISKRPWWTKWDLRSAEKDELERFVEARRPRDRGPRDRDVTNFLHDYSLFKNKVYPHFFERLVWLAVYAPTPPEDVALPDKDIYTFTNCLDRLRNRLSKPTSPGLSLCMISATHTQEIRSILPLKAKMFTSLARLGRKHHTPVFSVLYTVLQAWHLSDEAFTAAEQTADAAEKALLPYTKFILPSKHDLPLCSKGRSRSGQDEQAQWFAFDDPDWFPITLQWHSQVPKYHSDRQVYTWQPHLMRPNSEHVTIYVKRQSEERWKMLLIWKVDERNSFSTPRAYFAKCKELLDFKSEDQHQYRVAIIAFILTLFTQVIQDTINFSASFLQRIAFLRLQGRVSPSSSKLDFLLHLDDCRQSSCLGLRDAIILLDHISNYILPGTIACDPAVQKWCQDLKDELTPLLDNLVELGNTLTELRTMIKEQIDLQQIRLGRVLTIAAGIYLPFSFISGMFGMNVSDPLWNTSTHQDASSTPASATAHRVPATAATRAVTKGFKSVDVYHLITTVKSNTNNSGFTQNDTDAIIAAITGLSSPGAHLWSFKQFWYISPAVTALTILLPLTAGPTYRFVAQLSYQYRIYWQIFVLIFGVAAAVVLDIFIPPVPFTISFGAPQGAFAIWRVLVAHVRQQHKKRWIGYATILAECIVIDLQISGSTDSHVFIHFGQNVGLSGFLPPLYLFIIWIQRDPPLVSDARLVELVERYIPSVPGWSKRAQKSKLWTVGQKHRTLRKLVLFGAAIAPNYFLEFFLPGYVYLVATGLPYSLFSIDRFSNAIRLKRGRRRWTIFLLVDGLSVFLAVADIARLGIASLLFPTALLILFSYRPRKGSRLDRYFFWLFSDEPHTAFIDTTGTELRARTPPNTPQTV